MKTYNVTIPSWGYVRGQETWKVEAESPEHAIEEWYTGVLIDNQISRDDRERDPADAKATEVTN